MAAELPTLTLIRRANRTAEFIDRTTEERFDPAGLSLVRVSTPPAAGWLEVVDTKGLTRAAKAKVYEMSADGRRVENVGYLLPREVAHLFFEKF